MIKNTFELYSAVNYEAEGGESLPGQAWPALAHRFFV